MFCHSYPATTWDGGLSGGNPWCEGNKFEWAFSSPCGEEVGRMMLLPSSSFCCLLSASRAGRPGRGPRWGKEKGWSLAILKSLAMSWSSLPSRSWEDERVIHRLSQDENYTQTLTRWENTLHTYTHKTREIHTDIHKIRELHTDTQKMRELHKDFHKMKITHIHSQERITHRHSQDVRVHSQDERVTHRHSQDARPDAALCQLLPDFTQCGFVVLLVGHQQTNESNPPFPPYERSSHQTDTCTSTLEHNFLTAYSEKSAAWGRLFKSLCGFNVFWRRSW